jgi:manganese/zinc/iron transport system substrate-binding protein
MAPMTRWFLFLAFVFAAGCRGETSHDHGGKPRKLQVAQTYQGNGPLKVVCTIGMVADLVRNVGGPLVAVEQIMGSDVDPHLYKATPADIAKLSDADAVFYSGLHLEGKMADLLERHGRKKATFAVAEFLDPTALILAEQTHPDPHVWFDVSLWCKAAGVVGEALCLYDPANAATYKTNADKLQQTLADLHEETKAKIKTIPEERRVLVTSHDAFRYFGKAYDIQVKGIQGISTEAEASVRDIQNLVDFIAAKKVKAVFVESSVSQRNMEALREGCTAKGHSVAIGGELFSDAMGKEGTAEGTYVGMIRHNVDTIVQALK